MTKEILINRMYAGDYLKDNIGHEIINLFKTDDGDNYIYVNPYGTLGVGHDEVESILLVRRLEGGILEIIAKAEKLERIVTNKGGDDLLNDQKDYVKSHGIVYGKVPLDRIFEGYEQNSTYVSFKAGEIKAPIAPIYLYNSKSKINPDEKYGVKMEGNFERQALHQYYNQNENDYAVLRKILDDKSRWGDDPTKLVEVEFDKSKTNILTILGKDHDELAYSNLIAYLLSSDEELSRNFFTDVLKLEPSGELSVRREVKNIDLLLSDDNNIVVIENKIKSAINGVKDADRSIVNGKEDMESQLSKYYDYANSLGKQNKKKVSFFIFSPNYNHLDLKGLKNAENYKSVFYSELYEFFYNYHKTKKTYTNYYDILCEALIPHCRKVDNSNTEIMQERFATAIKEVRSKSII